MGNIHFLEGKAPELVLLYRRLRRETFLKAKVRRGAFARWVAKDEVHILCPLFLQQKQPNSPGVWILFNIIYAQILIEQLQLISNAAL